MTDSSWLIELVMCIGVLGCALLLLQSWSAWVRRAGGVLLLAGSGLGVWFLTGSVPGAVVGALMWVVLPVVQAVYVSRSLRISAVRRLEEGELPVEELPELGEWSGELRRLGFVGGGDYWLRPSPMEQGYRVLWREGDEVCDGTYGVVGVVKQGFVGMGYVMFVSPGKDGNVWVTWNYPMAQGLAVPPHHLFYRCVDVDSVEELWKMHGEYLKLNEVEVADGGSDRGREVLAGLFEETVGYNVKVGVLRRFRSGLGEQVAYTWRGTAYVSWQVLCEVTNI